MIAATHSSIYLNPLSEADSLLQGDFEYATALHQKKRRVVITQEICYTPGETQTQHTKKKKKTFEATPSHAVRGGSKGFSLCTHQMSLQEAPRSHLLPLFRERSHTLPPTKKPRFPVALRDFPGCTLGHVPLSETSIARPFRFVKSCVVSWRTKLW